MSYKVLLPQLVEDRDAIFKESDYFSGLTPKFIVPELRDLA